MLQSHLVLEDSSGQGKDSVDDLHKLKKIYRKLGMIFSASPRWKIQSTNKPRDLDVT